MSLEIRDSRNVLVANYHGYRVTRSLKPAPAAVRLYNSEGIRSRNVHVNAKAGLAFVTNMVAAHTCGPASFPMRTPFRT